MNSKNLKGIMSVLQTWAGSEGGSTPWAAAINICKTVMLDLPLPQNIAHHCVFIFYCNCSENATSLRLGAVVCGATAQMDC